MSDLYEKYLASGGPALPEGYSFQIEASDYYPGERYFFSILGPPSRRTKKRKPQFIDAPYMRYSHGEILLAHVLEKDKRNGAPPVHEWFVQTMRLVYGMWRAVNYEAEIVARWDSFAGVHP